MLSVESLKHQRSREARAKLRQMKESPGWSLSQKLTLANVILVLVTLGITMGIALRFSIELQERKVEGVLRDVGEMLANNQLVIEALQKNKGSDELMDFIDGIVVTFGDVDVITLADMKGRRLYHIDKDKIGLDFVGGDEEPALAGVKYFSKATGTRGFQKRYFMPIYGSPGGEQIGFLMTSALMSRIGTQRREIIVTHIQAAAMISIIGIVIACVLAKSIKSTLLGYEPGQLTQIYLEREEVLDSLEEGVLAVNAEGRIIVINRAAAAMLGVEDIDVAGQPARELFPQIRIAETALSGQHDYGRGLTQGGINIIYDRIPIIEDEQTIGAVAILRNRTELTSMAEQLTGVNHMMGALRSNTHEFMNKLHVILGLLRIGAADEAEKYITGIAREQTEVIGPVVQKIENKTVAALILGKMSRCRELNIDFRLDKSSFVPSNSTFLTSNAFVTVIGNLLENAIEAINAKPKEQGVRELSLLIHEDERSLMITVDDSGEGMTPEEIERVRQGGYSSKGQYRGTGTRLIRSILEASGGEMQIDSEKGVGTSITVCFTRREKRD